MTLEQSRQKYKEYIEEHVANVNLAWQTYKNDLLYPFCGDEVIQTLVSEQVKNHDKSKYSDREFESYRQYFFTAEGETKNQELMDEAWQHHKENNPHHWQVWTTRHYGYYQKSAYFIENLCDWIAMGMKFDSTAKDYYEKNKDEIKLPPEYIPIMYEIFTRIYLEKN